MKKFVPIAITLASILIVVMIFMIIAGGPLQLIDAILVTIQGWFGISPSKQFTLSGSASLDAAETSAAAGF